jgi:hypothetical protein
MNNNSHSGIIINNMTILSVKKQKTKKLTNQEKEDQIKNVLHHYQVDNNKAVNDLTNAMKGKQIVTQQLVIKKEK